MKSFIYKTNKFLLEKYPLIWNTKLLWVLSVALFFHIIFFILGFLALANVEQLHQHDAKSIFFKNGTIYVSMIISILLLVIWCIQLFKNNAFKSFYPTSKLKLFKTFLSYLVIIFSTTTFFLSYNYGIKTYISTSYNNAKIETEIAIANKAAIFFSDALEKYTMDQKRYPAPFDSLYCETFTGDLKPYTLKNDYRTAQNKNLPNDSLSHIKFLDTKYFFYRLYSKEGTVSDAYNNSDYKGFVFFESLENSKRNYFYKDFIVDVSQLIKTPKPSYFNYSSTFYSSKKESINNFKEYAGYSRTKSLGYNNPFSETQKSSNKIAYHLLKRNNPDEIKQVLNDFLSLCKAYKINNNINGDTWFNLVYHPSKFEVKALIRTEPKIDYQYKTTTQNTPSQKFESDILTNYHIEHDKLRNLFSNVEDIKGSTPYIESIHFFLWFTMFLATVIFMFRTTGLKPLLFSIIVSGVLALVVGLSTTLFAFITGFNDDTVGYFAAYFTFFLGTIVLLIPLIFREHLKKSIVAICLNISVSGFVLYVLLIILIISLHQNDACPSFYDPINKCFNILSDIGILWSFILFVVNLVFLYFYTEIIKTWKGLPEG